MESQGPSTVSSSTPFHFKKIIDVGELDGREHGETSLLLPSNWYPLIVSIFFGLAKVVSSLESWRWRSEDFAGEMSGFDW